MTIPESAPISPTPLLNEALIARLRDDLAAAGWTVTGVEALLSPMALAAMRRDQFTPAAMELESEASAAAVLTRLFMLAEPVAAEAVERALPSLGVAGASELGLVRDVPAAVGADSQSTATLSATLDLRPYAGSWEPAGAGPEGVRADGELHEANFPHWWVASDLSQAQTGEPPREDYVLGIAAASNNLARLTLRDPVDSALDLGCGCGILALQLASHVKRVVATDISERACAFTRFNALLNRVTIDVRQGSFFEPVEGERFDLITSNPPFVITPQAVRVDSNLEYRDGGMERDQLIPMIIRQAIAHLAPHGTSHMLANWEVKGNEFEWATRPRQWIERAADAALAAGQSVDAWLVQRDLLDIAQYAEWWIRDGLGARVTPTRWRAEYRTWLGDFSSAGTTFVGLGSLALRVGAQRAVATGDAGDLNVVCEYLPEGPPVDGPAVRTALGNLSLPPEWETIPLVCAPDVREARYFVPGSTNPELIHVTQGRAGGRERAVTSAVAALIGVSDGELAPAQVIPAIAMLLEQDEGQVRAEIKAALPELLRAGVVQFLPASE